VGTARAARTQPGADIPGEECHAPRIGTKRCRPRAGAGVPIAGPVCPALMEFREAKRRVLPDTRWLGVESDGCARLDVEGYSWKGGRLSFSGKIQFAECYIGLNTTTSLGVDDEIAGNRVTAGQQRPAWGGAARRRQRYSPHRCGDFLSPRRRRWHARVALRGRRRSRGRPHFSSPCGGARAMPWICWL